MPSRSVTLTEVAEKADVSVATASAVLHRSDGNNSRFSEPTRRRVTAAARKLGYRANRTARNYRRRRHGAVGVMHGENGLVPPLTLEAMSRSLAGDDRVVMFSHVRGGVPIFVREDAVDGLVVFGDLEDALAETVARLQMPALHVNSNRRLKPGTVTYDERGGTKRAVHHLAERGRARLIYLQGVAAGREPVHYSVPERWAGVVEGCSECGLPEAERVLVQGRWRADVRRSPPDSETMVAEFTRILEEHPAADAAVLQERILAVPLYEAARRLGRAIPEELAVVAVNPFNLLDYSCPPLTMVSLDFRALGMQVAEAANRAIEDGVDSVDPVVFPMTLFARRST